MTKLWALIVHCHCLEYFANAGGNISICSRISLFEMTTNRVSLCHPQPRLPCHPCLLLTWYTKQIFGHYLSLRNKLPGRLCCFKKLARGPGKRKRNVSSNVWCLFVSLLGSILLCVPRQARLSSVALESYCSPPTFTIWTKERKRWQR